MSMQKIQSLYASRSMLTWEQDPAQLNAIANPLAREIVASLLRCVFALCLR